MAPWRSCELSNMVGTLTAFVLSALGVILYCVSVGSVDRALKGAGSGTEQLRGVVRLQDGALAFVLVLNIISTASIGLSTFHIGSCQNPLTHALTSSKGLCIQRVLAAISFMVQLINSQFLMIALTAVSTMSYICSLGHPVQYQTQQLVYSIGNWTVSSGSAGYDPYGPPQDYSTRDTPLVSLKRLLRGLDMNRYCGVASQDLQRGVVIFWLACLLTVLSQALMTVTINGEKERVYMHELHEEAHETSGGFLKELQHTVHEKQQQFGEVSSSLYSQVQNRSFSPLLGGGSNYH